MRLGALGLISLLLLAVVFTGTAPSARAQEYVIGAGDVLDIVIQGEPELSRSYLVRPDGKIAMPMLGEVEAAGLTSKALADRLAAQLKPFVRDPQVTVAIRQAARRKFVYLLGQVVRPGAYEFLEGWTIAELLASAGGTTEKASLRRAVIMRRNQAISVDLEQLIVKGNPQANAPLEPGDVVIVSAVDDRVHVLGEVAKPGYHELREGDRILDIITKAGGVSLKGAPERISILRPEGALTVDLLGLLQKGQVDQNVLMRTGDIVYVPETENRVIALGAVMKPGSYVFKPGDRVIDLISAAGGPTPKAALSDVGVIRQNGQNGEVVPTAQSDKNPSLTQVNLDKFLKGGDTSQNVTLKPGDVVYVPDRVGINWTVLLSSIREFGLFFLLLR